MTAPLLTAVLAAALAVYLGASVALLVGIARRAEWWRVVVAIVLPPLAPLWGWRFGMRARVVTWLAALLTYAIAAAVAAA